MLSVCILGLAKELGHLIESRHENKNFQLVIITHDKEFLKYLSAYSPTYYRIFKVSVLLCLSNAKLCEG